MNGKYLMHSCQSDDNSQPIYNFCVPPWNLFFFTIAILHQLVTEAAISNICPYSLTALIPKGIFNLRRKKIFFGKNSNVGFSFDSD